MPQLPKDYAERVYAGWIGKNIGVRFGAPIENWTYQQILDHLGEIDTYLPLKPGMVFQPDDDVAVPTVLIRALEDYGLDADAYHMGRTLLNYLGDQHGSLWWGGYGVSTEHTAYLNMKNGIPAPLSGSAQLNGLTVAEQIGGQIFSDLWGMIFPADVVKAASYAKAAASVTHDGNGVYGGMFVAAMVSAAFTTSDPLALIEAGLSVIPKDCDYARVVKDVTRFYQENPSDWRACYRFITENYGYDRYGGIVHIIPNAGVIVMGILYGGGDFSRSICITNMAGWDTDCNVGNVGAVMGTAVGLAGIHSSWREPLQDFYLAASIIGSANMPDIPGFADRLVRLGQAAAGETPLSPKARCHFDYPGATHGFDHNGPQRNMIGFKQEFFDGHGVLKGIVRLLKKKQDMRIFVNTYYHPKQLNSDYYGAGFSPQIYPGQKLTAKLYFPEDAPQMIYAGLTVYDSNHNTYYQGKSVNLVPGQWMNLEWTIPFMEDVCLAQAGIIFRNLSPDTWKGSFYLDDFDWSGEPDFTTHFAQTKNEYGAASQWTFLRGFWRVEDGAYHGSGVEENETYTGLLDWKDLELTAQLRPLYGKTHLVNVRVQGALRSYAAGLADGKLVLYKKEDGLYVEKASQPFNWSADGIYQINIAVEGNRIMVKILDQEIPVISWVDETDPYLTGMIGLTNFSGCHTAYETITVEPY